MTAGALFFLTNASLVQADTLPDINWVSDSSSSFDVVISGTGLGWSGTIASPSGLWQLKSANVIDYGNAGFPSSLVFVDNVGVATFEGRLPPGFPAPDPAANPPYNSPSLATFGGYWDGFDPVAPINDGNNLNCGYLNKYGDWSGKSAISITSIPNVCDTSTWTWTAQYFGSGNNLEALATPEPGTLSLCGLFLLMGIMRAIQRSKSPGLAQDGRGAGGGTRP